MVQPSMHGLAEFPLHISCDFQVVLRLWIATTPKQRPPRHGEEAKVELTDGVKRTFLSDDQPASKRCPRLLRMSMSINRVGPLTVLLS